MGINIYMAVLAALMCVNVCIYRKELKFPLPGDELRQKKKELKNSIMVMTAKHKAGSLERELFSSSVTLKNLSIVRREAPISADYMYEKLVENGGKLKPVFSHMLTLYRTGHDEEAFNIVAAEIGTKSAKNFAYILSKIDKMNPVQLAGQMEIFQEMMTEKAVTAAMKRTQRNGAVITVCASMSIFALLINFTVVVIFMDTIDVLNSIFV